MKKNVHLFVLVVLAVFVVNRDHPALAKDLPKTPEKPAETFQPFSEAWYRGIVESVDGQAGTLTLRAKLRGETLHQRATASGDPFAVSSSAAVPAEESKKAFKCARDCRFIYLNKPNAGLSDFRAGYEVVVIYTEQNGALLAQKIAVEPPASDKKPPGRRPGGKP